MMRPTACWKLEWEELETNQQHFTALCKTLQDRVSHTGSLIPSTRQINVSVSKISNFNIILPL